MTFSFKRNQVIYAHEKNYVAGDQKGPSGPSKRPCLDLSGAMGKLRNVQIVQEFVKRPQLPLVLDPRPPQPPPVFAMPAEVHGATVVRVLSRALEGCKLPALAEASVQPNPAAHDKRDGRREESGVNHH